MASLSSPPSSRSSSSESTTMPALASSPPCLVLSLGNPVTCIRQEWLVNLYYGVNSQVKYFLPYQTSPECSRLFSWHVFSGKDQAVANLPPGCSRLRNPSQGDAASVFQVDISGYPLNNVQTQGYFVFLIMNLYHLHCLQALLHLVPPISIKVTLIALAVGANPTEIQGE